MKLTKLNENFSIEDSLDNLKISGNVSKNQNGSVNININITKENESVGDCYYSVNERVNFNVNTNAEDLTIIVNYFKGLIDAVLNDSALANS